MIDTTAPCTCCADIWVYLDKHVLFGGEGGSLINHLWDTPEKGARLHSDDGPILIATLHAELTALYADNDGFPVTIDQLDHYMRYDY